MAAPRLDVDHEAVKTLAVAIGVREAARRMGLNEDVVRQWSSREQWFAPTPVAKTMQPIAVTNVTKPSVALATTISDNCNRARSVLSKVALKGAHAFDKLPGDALTDVKTSAALRNHVASTSEIGGWKDEAKSGVNVAVNVGIVGG